MEKADRVRHDPGPADTASPVDQIEPKQERGSYGHIVTALVIVAVFAIGAALASVDFLAMRQADVIHPSDGLTSIRMLSDYFEGIKETSGDTKVYLYDSGVPGATVLLLGGTHPNEPAGFMAAIVVAENLKVSAGRVLVVPQVCASGFTCTDPFEGCPQSFTLQGQQGPRTFRFGSRVSNPLDQWPDPLVYLHYPSGQQLSGFETRNLNRSYPGRSDGTFTEKVGHAIMQMIEAEHVDIAFDLHEAAPEIPIINAIVYHEKSEDVALDAVLELEMEGLHYSPELSPVNFRGLSHREWGDRTRAMPFLMETSNPIQGRLRGRTNEDLIIKGVSERYKQALESGALRIEYLPEGEPLERRVGRHIAGFRTVLNVYNKSYPENPIVIENLPSYDELMANGVGHYLQ